MYRPLNQYHVVMEVAPQFQQTPEALQNIYLRSTAGTPVPLAAFTHYEPSNTPLAVNHQGQVAFGHDLIQPGSGGLSGTGDAGH